MIEMLYNAIRVDGVADLCAEITEPDGTAITSGEVYLSIPSLGLEIEGEYDDEVWNFTIPEVEEKGRYEYKVLVNGQSVEFGAPIYFS